MEIHLSPELEELVDSEVRSGRYRSADEVVGEALLLLAQRGAGFAFRTDEMRAQIEEGWLAAERGELVDCDEVFDRIDLELAELGRADQK
jgi:antitoxin ParD1/3/4